MKTSYTTNDFTRNGEPREATKESQAMRSAALNREMKRKARVRRAQRLSARRQFASKFVRVSLAVVLALSFVPMGAYGDYGGTSIAQPPALDANAVGGLTAGGSPLFNGGSDTGENEAKTPNASPDESGAADVVSPETKSDNINAAGQLRDRLNSNNPILPRATLGAASLSNALRPAAAHDDLLTVNVEKFNALQKDGNVYLYDFRNSEHVAAKIEVEMKAGMFDGGWRKVRVELPQYGFAFVDTLASDLNAHSEVRNAAFTKQNGYNTILTFEVQGNVETVRHLDLQTKLVALTNAQCASVIANGWQDMPLKVTVSDATQVIAENTRYTLRPKADNYEDIITVQPHKWDVTAYSRFANGDGGIYYGPTFEQKDDIRFSIRKAGGADGVGLIKLGAFKVYVPDERLYLYRAGMIGYTGTDYQLMNDNRFTVSDAKNDNDGKGTYYLFTPGKRETYNYTANASTETVTTHLYITWRVKDTETNKYLDSNDSRTEYKARDMQIEFVEAGGSTTSINPTDSGSVFYTLPVKKSTNYSFVESHQSIGGYATYRKRFDQAGGQYISNKKVAPDSYGDDVVFVPLRQESGGKTEELRGPEHATETYRFPYEVQPTGISWKGSSVSLGEIEEVSWTVVDADGNKVRDEKFTGKKVLGNSLDLGPLDSAQGERISEVTVKWSFLWGANVGGAMPYVACAFDYYVPSTDAQGISLENGRLIQIKYEGIFDDPAFPIKTFAATAAGGASDYLYLQVVDKSCMWPVGVGAYAGGDYRTGDLSSGENVQISDYLALKGPSGMSRDYIDNPVIDLKLTASAGIGLQSGNGLFFLSGDMVLTKEMSGWTIKYEVCDKDGGNIRQGSYLVPELEGDTQIDLETLGVSNDERFLSFSLTYNGRYQIKDATREYQSGRNQDGSLAGFYDMVYLLKSIKVRMLDTGLSGEHLGDGTITFSAVLKHGGTCNRVAHSEAGETMLNNGTSQYYPTLINVLGSYLHSLKGIIANKIPNTVNQGGSIIADFVFNGNYAAEKRGATATNERLPYVGVPESIYIELKDRHTEPDLTDSKFLASLKAHGMTADNVSVLEKDGRRWLVLKQNAGETIAWGSSLPLLNYTGSGKWHSFAKGFTIALRVWEGHELGDTNPFGEVYYDLSQYLKVYDGSEASGWRTVRLLDTVADEHGLLGDGDTTTARLWKTDASNVTVDVQRNTSTGAVVYPGKNGMIDYSGTVVYKSAERGGLFADVSINSPNTNITTHNYEVVLSLPRKDDVYSWAESGATKSITSDNGLALKDAAFISKSTLGADSNVTITYSADGTSYTASPASWADVRYVKVLVDKIDPYKSFAVRLPVATDAPDGGVSRVAAIGGTWAFKMSADGESTDPAVMKPALFVSAPTINYSVAKQLKAPAELGEGGSYDHAYSFGANVFGFTITPLSGAPMPGGVASKTVYASASAEGGIATFPDNEYDAPGTYKYEVREAIPADAVNVDGVSYANATDAQKKAGGFEKDGIVYSERVASVTVTVKQDASGRLVASSSAATTPLVFTNRYEVDDASLVLGGYKKMKKADGTVTDEATGYSFYLERLDGGTVDNGQWTYRYTAGPDAQSKGKFNFAPLEFTQVNLDAGAQIVYRIREAIPDDAVNAAGKAYKDASEDERAQGGFAKLGVTYDQSAYTATVTLVNNGNGTMTPNVTYAKVRNKDGAAIPAQEVSDAGVIFQNEYSCTGTATLRATKDLEGREWAENGSEKFTFELRPSGVSASGPAGTVDTSDEAKASVPMPAAASGEGANRMISKQVTKDTRTVAFDDIVFTHADIGKTFAYRITEHAPASGDADFIDELRYSDAVYGVQVTPVRDKGDGTIEVQVKYALQVLADNGAGGTTEQWLEIPGTPTFTNKYIGHGTVNLYANKVLNGRDWAADDAFEFELWPKSGKKENGQDIGLADIPMPANSTYGYATAAAGGNDRSAEFPVIQYTHSQEGNEYHYTMRERIPEGAQALDKTSGAVVEGVTYSDELRGSYDWTLNGVKYTTKEYEARVKVDVHDAEHASDENYVTTTVEYLVDLNGQKVWIPRAEAYFVNEYTATPATVTTIQAQKLLKAPANINADHSYDQAYAFAGDRFSFTLRPGTNEAGVMAPMPSDGQGGQQGSLGATASECVVRDGKIVEGGIATFGEIEYTAPGRYVYTITENIPDNATATIGETSYTHVDALKEGSGLSAAAIATADWHLNGVTYTTGAHTVYVDVTDNGKGQLVANVATRGEAGALVNEPAPFTNRYHTRDVPVVIAGSKTVNSQEPGAGYSFKLARIDDEDSGREGYTTSERFASSAADGSFSFPELVFPQFRLGKTSVYRVSEVIPDDAENAAHVKYADADEATRAAGGFTLANIAYDASVFEVRVTMVDNGDGTMHPEVAYTRLRNFDGSLVPDGEAVEEITFDNRIYPAGTAVLQVEKQLKGRDWEEGDSFEFVAEAVSIENLQEAADGAGNGEGAEGAEGEGAEGAGGAEGEGAADVEIPVPETAATATYETRGGPIDFGAIAYTSEYEGKRITYKLTEKAGQVEGITYSRDVYYAVVDLHGVGNGTLETEIAYYRDSVADGNQLGAGEVPLFTNYAGLAPCKNDPPVRKVVEGAPSQPGEFTFTMTPNDPSYPMMEGTVDGVKTVVQHGAGAVEFGEIEFTYPGTYDYTVREVAGTSSEYTYDTSEWTVRYTVTEQDMQLHADRVFLKDGQPVDALEATFTNVYKAGSPGGGVDPDPEPEPDPDPDPDPAVDPSPVTKPDVSVVKSADKQTVKAGDQVTYTITVANKGDGAAKGVYVKDYVPAGMTYVSSSGAGAKYGSTTDRRAFATWWIESLQPGASETLTLVVRVNECRKGDKFENVALWQEVGGVERPSPSVDPGNGTDAKTSNKVVITADASTASAAAKAAAATKSSLPSTGDSPLLVAVLLLAGLASAACAIGFNRRRSDRR